MTLAGVLIAAGFGGGTVAALSSWGARPEPRECPDCASDMPALPRTRPHLPGAGHAYACLICRHVLVEEFTPRGWRTTTQADRRGLAPLDCVAA